MRFSEPAETYFGFQPRVDAVELRQAACQAAVMLRATIKMQRMARKRSTFCKYVLHVSLQDMFSFCSSIHTDMHVTQYTLSATHGSQAQHLLHVSVIATACMPMYSVYEYHCTAMQYKIPMACKNSVISARKYRIGSAS